MTKKGKFIVIEGGVGSGKSTVFRKLKKRFKDWKYYREPGIRLLEKESEKPFKGFMGIL